MEEKKRTEALAKIISLHKRCDELMSKYQFSIEHDLMDESIMEDLFGKLMEIQRESIAVIKEVLDE